MQDAITKPTKIWPTRALDFAFRCNTIGNYVGWGALLCMFMPEPIKNIGWFIGIFVLSILVPPVILVNLFVLIALAIVRLQGQSVVFIQPKSYYLKGVISTILFFIGGMVHQTLFWGIWYLLTNAAAHSTVD